MISLGFKNLFQSCVPFGNQFNMYSAPTIANKNDLAVLLSVAKNIIPFFFNSLEQDLINKSTSATCSIISKHKITSNCSF